MKVVGSGLGQPVGSISKHRAGGWKSDDGRLAALLSGKRTVCHELNASDSPTIPNRPLGEVLVDRPGPQLVPELNGNQTSVEARPALARERGRSWGNSQDTESVRPNRDILFNNKRKVLFETALAGLILKEKPRLFPAVHKASVGACTVLQETLFNPANWATHPNLVQGLVTTINGLDTQQEFNRFLGRDHNTAITSNEFHDFVGWAVEALANDNESSFGAKMSLLYLYAGFVSRPDRLGMDGVQTMDDVPDALFRGGRKASVVSAYHLHKSQSFDRTGYFDGGKSASRRPQSGVRIAKETTKGTLQPHGNPMTSVGGITPGEGVRSVRGVGDYDLKSDVDCDTVKALIRFGREAHGYEHTAAGIHQPQPSAQALHRAKSELSLPSRTNDFYYQAIDHDMPLVGAASGGAGVYEIVFQEADAANQDNDNGDGLSADEWSHLRMAVLANYISKGYHSSHEVGAVQKLFGANYTPGNYESLLTKEIVALPEYRAVRRHFQDIFPRGHSQFIF